MTIMGNIKEPVGIDLNLPPIPCTDEDRKAISAIIAHYKKTGEVPKIIRREKAMKDKKAAVQARRKPAVTKPKTGV